MRYCLLGMAAFLFVAMVGTGQEAKKKKEAEAPTEIKEIAGKSFEQWVMEIHAKDPSDREVAIKTVLNFGAKRAYEAVPAILKELAKHKPLGAPIDLSVRVNGTIALGTIFFATKEPDEKDLKDAAKIFKVNLEDKQAFLKIRTLQALPSLRGYSRDALPDVIKAINDVTTWETRKEAIQTLTYLVSFEPKKGPPPGSLTALYGALKDGSAIVRRAALQSLVTMGFISEADKPKIIVMVNDLIKREPREIVRIEAHKAIINLKRKKFDDPIDTATKRNEHLLYIEGKVNSKDPTTRLNALQALGSLGPPAASTAPTVIAAIADPDGNLGGVAVEALMHMKVLSAIRKDYLKKIEDMVQAKASTTKLNALKALSATGPDAPFSAIKTVEDAIHDKDVNVGVAAITSLLHMEAYSAIPMLTTMKDDPKANEVLKAAAETAIDQFKYVKDMRKKISEKKKTDKK